MAAELAITSAGLTVGTVTEEHSSTVPQGQVIRQSPAAGVMLAKGSAVGLVVSVGPIPSPEMMSISGGQFWMGDPWGEGDANELPYHPVTLSAYKLGKYHVTNQEYVDILNWALDTGRLTDTAGDITAYVQVILRVTSDYCQISYSGGRFVVESRDSRSMEDHPVVMVTWFGAAVYCNWLSERHGLQACYNTTTWECNHASSGYRLPTEAQWEFAAAWTGASHYRYGNGSDSISSADANYLTYNPLGLTSYPYTTSVGYYAGRVSPAGCYDMCGNVFDWCNDWYAADYYLASPANDPLGPATGTERVGRGGCWGCVASECRTAIRGKVEPFASDYGVGFRVAAP